MNYKLPFYYNDFVIIKLNENHFGVQNVEDFHTDSKKLLFKSSSIDGCLEYLDGRVDILYVLKKLFPFRRFVKKFYHLLRDLKINIYNNIILKNSINDKKIIEFSGWAEPFIDTRVGTHPVFNFTTSPPEGYCFTQSKHIKLLNILNVRIFLIYLYVVRLSFKFFIKKIPIKFIVKFLSTRRIRQISDLPVGKNNVVLYPTYPFLVEQHSWFIEIEDMLTLMNPFVSNGTFNPNLNRQHPIVKILEILFESDRFKGVISHLKSTADGLKILFKDNPNIPQKIYYIPLGTQIGPQIIRSRNKKNINILFLNGWAQDPKAFYRRGGLDALESFSYIAEEYPNVKLVVRSPLPRLEDKFQKILTLKNIEVIDKKLSRESLHNLYEKSEILLFPAVRIAVTTLLQAMENSLAIVASDGFGIEEYIEDGINGLISKGFYGSTGYIDDEGIYRENWLLSLKSNPEVCKNAANNLRRLISDPEYLLKIQEGARRSIEQKYSINSWNRELKKVLDNF